MLSDRPTKTVDFELPFSFVMGPHQISQIAYFNSLGSILSDLICLDSEVIATRLEKVKAKQLDHALMLFTAENIPVKTASIDGIRELLLTEFPDVATRFERVFSQMKGLGGADNFQARIDRFSAYWEEWRIIRECTWIAHSESCSKSIDSSAQCICNNYSFARYCTEIDTIYAIETDPESLVNHSDDSYKAEQALIMTRKMLCVMFGCNQFYGFDGYTYDSHGKVTGEEFLAANRKLNDEILCVFLSDIERFQLV